MPSSFSSSSILAPLKIVAEFARIPPSAPEFRRIPLPCKQRPQNLSHGCERGFEVVVDYLMIIFAGTSKFRPRGGQAPLNRALRFRVPVAQPFFERLEARRAHEDRHRVGAALAHLL